MSISLFRRPPPDLLFPTGDGKNRDEYFLVELDDVLLSSVESVFYGLLQLPDDRKNFPKIEQFAVIDPEKFYYDYSILNPVQFLVAMMADNSVFSPDYFTHIIRRALEVDTWVYHSKLMMLYALYDLASHKFVKRIDIVCRRPVREWELQGIYAIFQKYIDKVNIYNGSIFKLTETYKEYTTVILSSVDKLLTMIKHPDMYHLERTLLLLRNSLDNVDIVESGDELRYKEKHNEEIQAAVKSTTCKVGRFYSTLYHEPESPNVVLGVQQS